MDSNTILISTLTALIGAVAGTYFGSYFLFRRQESKIKEVRKIAIKGLKIITKYAKSSNTYDKANEEFNTSLNVAEKRAILVSLNKLGIPIEIPQKDVFNINAVKFLNKPIDKSEIDVIIQQIEKGHCDHLFFLEVDSHFTSNLRINTIRNIGKKFVQEVFANSTYNSTTHKIILPEEWTNKFTHGEIKAILVFHEQLFTSNYFDTKGNPDDAKISNLIKEIEIGIWDGYLFWDYDGYRNVMAQIEMSDVVKNAFKLNNKQPIKNNVHQKK